MVNSIGSSPGNNSFIIRGEPLRMAHCDNFTAEGGGPKISPKTSLARVARAARRRIDRGGPRAGAGIADGGLGAEGTGDGHSEFLAIGGIGAKPALGGIADVAALQQETGDLRVAREADVAADHATVAAFYRADLVHGLLAADREAVAIDAPVIGFRAADVGRAAVVMDADEDAIRVMIGAGHAIIELDEGVVIAHEDDAEIAAELGPQASGGVEGELFLHLAGVRAGGAAVLAAVAGVDDDSSETLRPGTVAIDIEAPRKRGGCATGGGVGSAGGDERSEC